MLRKALAIIHSDKAWWQAIGIAGLASMTIFGYPLATGLVVEHMENTRKGFASPLPPFIDWSTRWLMGLFALLIDFLFYVMPLMIAAFLFFCGGLTLLVRSTDTGQDVLVWSFIGGLGGWWLIMFLSGVSAVGRLIYLDDSGPERALTGFPLREAFRTGARRYYLRARLASLPLFIVQIALVACLPSVLDMGGWIGQIGAVLLAWLFLSSLVYANVVTMLIYHQVDQELADSPHVRPQLGE
jgi:hypothetical protein